MAYIPRGCHQQGRIKQTGVWLPRRAHESQDLPRDEFACTYSDGETLDAAVGAKHAVDADLLLAQGVMTGPYRRTKPVKRGPVRRFFRALLAFLLAPRPYL